jgi:exopolyphosphatase/pppGpp-phosphohydrolase
MILAGIDIGTNTLRLLIAEADRGSFREIHSDRRITRLGQNLDRAGRLSREAGERSLQVLRESRTANRHGALHTAAIGTSALRIGKRAGIHRSVKHRTGLAVIVVSEKRKHASRCSGCWR